MGSKKGLSLKMKKPQFGANIVLLHKSLDILKMTHRWLEAMEHMIRTVSRCVPQESKYTENDP